MSSGQPTERGARFWQLAPAFVGLVGVLIGAGATSGVTYLGDHRRAKADERGAERLVLAEVQSDDTILRNNPRLHLANDAWRVERERLARSLNNTEWAWLAKYYRDLGQVDRGATPRAIHRLEVDEPCALAALNVWSYTPSPYFKALRKNVLCKSPPDAP